ncbi:MAG: formyltransferase family protein, partial [Patescibacteria group bacterium]|nr:formyltransferase family protein [Patescibacteria group bacterium]
FASGTRDGSGSGFENLVEASREGTLDADIVAVVSNHEYGGVRQRAERLGIPFVYFSGPYDAEHYSSILSSYAEASKDRQNTRIEKSELWVALSGWLKKVEGLDPRKTFNIHPALLSQLGGRFGGPGMYRHRVHEAVSDALERGGITESGVTMHFVTDMYDRGPAFFEYHVPLEKGMSAEDIAKAVNAAEHEWQPKITNMVVHGQIRWDGKDPASLEVPSDYEFLPASTAEVHD